MAKLLIPFSEVVKKIISLDRFCKSNSISRKNLSDNLIFKVMGPFSEAIREKARKMKLNDEWIDYDFSFFEEFSDSIKGDWVLDPVQGFSIMGAQPSTIYLFLIYSSDTGKKVRNTISLRYELTYAQLSNLINFGLVQRRFSFNL
ncbi:hypothetical protein J4216_03285 [Candidatus Woesearchaeota archaeon]|nr:hypothetical protein [Candidatus Woesearchaeota archaeon]